jgi:CRISPR-associated protein Cas5t
MILKTDRKRYMKIFSVKGVSITASFRVPETHTFQQTLPLPPKTAIIGMIGAALGLKLENAYKYVDDNEILIGICGTHKGFMRDLWKYRKIKAKEETHSVLTREYLCYNEFYIYFASDKTDLTELKSAIYSPVYPLTAGNSDDLIKIAKISDIFTVQKEKLYRFEHTVLPGDITESYKCDIDISKIPITKTLYYPLVFILPTRFFFKEGKERKVVKKDLFTFVNTAIILESPIDGYIVEGRSVVLL